MKESSKKIKNTEKESANGLMEKNIWDNGKMDSEMAMDFGQLEAERKLIQDSGRMEKYLVMDSTLKKIILNLKDIFKIL